jgi:ACS family tartrate transporter-like MFS transporter
MRHPVVWLLVGVYFLVHTCNYSVTMWQPQILQSVGRLSNMQLGLLNAAPSVVGAIAMVLIAMHSDRTGERRMHVAGSALVACLGLAIAGRAHSLPAAFIGLALTSAGINGLFGPFWAMSTSLLAGTGAAAGIAAINSLGNLGGFVGPYLTGIVEARTHSFTVGLYMLALSALGSAALAAAIPRPRRAREIAERDAVEQTGRL